MKSDPTLSGSTSQPCALDARLTGWLLAQGFPSDDLEAVIENRATPLMQACRFGDWAMVDALIQAGASLDAVNGDGNNALWLACYNGDPKIIDRLVSSGIAVDHRNDSGATCLMYAASSGKAKVVAQLLAAGANDGLKNLDDFTALDMAANLECLRLLTASHRRDASAQAWV